MKPTFLRNHIVAATYGLIFALFCGLVSVALQPFPFYVVFVAPLWGLLFYAIPTYLGIVLARSLAKRLGPYDLFAILPGMLALVLSFSFDFASSARTWLTSRGEVHGTILGAGPPPEDIDAWIARGLSQAVWIGLMVTCGILWKRSREAESPSASLTPAETSKIFLCIFIESLVAVGLSFMILHADLQQRRVWSSPDNVFARAAAVLQDKDASAGDRALALNTIEGSRDERATDILRRAVREETGETQLSAAAHLIGRDDLLALSVLEGPLMQGTQLTGTILPTTSHTPSEGNGNVIAGFGPIGTLKFGMMLPNVKDPAAVPVLIRLLTSPDVEVRRGAASALRNLKAPSAIDALLIAINDPDSQVRYFAMCALMTATGDPHYPATLLFYGDEASYLNPWKVWAADRSQPPPKSDLYKKRHHLTR